MAELEFFQAQRPRLFSIAYRMLGSASDAEDVLQDAWVRFNNKVRMTAAGDVGAVDRSKRTAPAARLTTEDPDDRDERRTVAARFVEAFRSGDASGLAQLLAADVTFVADGKATAARKPLAGQGAVLNLLVGLVRSARASGLAAQATMEAMEVNSEPAIVLRVGGQLDGVFVLSIERGTIAGIRVVRNPDKLAYLGRQLAGPNLGS